MTYSSLQVTQVTVVAWTVFYSGHVKFTIINTTLKEEKYLAKYNSRKALAMIYSDSQKRSYTYNSE